VQQRQRAWRDAGPISEGVLDEGDYVIAKMVVVALMEQVSKMEEVALDELDMMLLWEREISSCGSG
jgi:hypothetical protein